MWILVLLVVAIISSIWGKVHPKSAKKFWLSCCLPLLIADIIFLIYMANK